MKLTSHPRRGTAGHGGAWLELRWPGCHHWAEPQVCLQASSLPAPAALPAPQTSASPGATPTRFLSLPLGTSRSFLTTKVTTSLSPHGSQMYQVNARLGVYFNFSSQGLELTLQQAQRGPGGGGGWKWRKAGVSPHTHLLPGHSVQFLVSGKLCLPWVTDG